MLDPALVRSIEEDYSGPTGYLSPAERAKQNEAEQRRRLRAEHAERRKQRLHDAQRARVDEYWNGLSDEEQEKVRNDAFTQASTFARKEYEDRLRSSPDTAGLWLKTILAAHISAILEQEAGRQMVQRLEQRG